VAPLLEAQEGRGLRRESTTTGRTWRTLLAPLPGCANPAKPVLTQKVGKVVRSGSGPPETGLGGSRSLLLFEVAGVMQMERGGSGRTLSQVTGVRWEVSGAAGGGVMWEVCQVEGVRQAVHQVAGSGGHVGGALGCRRQGSGLCCVRLRVVGECQAFSVSGCGVGVAGVGPQAPGGSTAMDTWRAGGPGAEETTELLLEAHEFCAVGQEQVEGVTPHFGVPGQ
jgi:hypothetical protein